MRAVLRVAGLLAGVALAAPAAMAHSVGWKLLPEAEAVVVQFSYGDGAPIAFAEVAVTGPDGRVHQKGRADRFGLFALAMPDGGPAGDWQMAVVDGEGHKLTARFSADTGARIVEIRERVGQAMSVLAVLLLVVSVGLALRLHAVTRGRRGV